MNEKIILKKLNEIKKSITEGMVLSVTFDHDIYSKLNSYRVNELQSNGVKHPDTIFVDDTADYDNLLVIAISNQVQRKYWDDEIGLDYAEEHQNIQGVDYYLFDIEADQSLLDIAEVLDIDEVSYSEY